MFLEEVSVNIALLATIKIQSVDNKTMNWNELNQSTTIIHFTKMKDSRTKNQRNLQIALASVSCVFEDLFQSAYK